MDTALVRRVIATWLAVLSMVLVAGCGGGSSSSNQYSAGAEPSEQFLGPTGHDELVEFGAEAPVAEREAASAVLNQNFEARAAAEFSIQCTSLTEKEIEIVLGSKKSASVSACAKKLEALAKPLQKSAAIRKDRLDGPITAMRVKGNRGFALFHGTEGQNWIMPLEREDGSWKVAAIEEEELPSKSSKNTASKGSRDSSG